MATDLALAVFAGSAQTALGPIVEQDVLSIGASHDFTAALGANQSTAITVRLQPDTACWVAWGPSATASATNGIRMVAGSTEYVSLAPSDRVSAIQL